MCGRYGRRADKQRIAEWMQAHDTGVFDDSYFAPSYNVAPQSWQPVVRLGAETGERELTVMRWGLVPGWSKDGKAGYSTINARAETITTSPAYREAIKRRRCLVPADWFYEWQKLDAKTKQPYAIALKDGDLFAFAGLWETWRDKATGQGATGQGATGKGAKGQTATGQSATSLALETYTIITTDPNELTERFHDRMPVILKPSDYQRWLEPGEPSHLPVDLLRPFPADEMKAWKVGPDVGNVRNNRPELVEQIE
jgi:putative SOS response-associated peptidase YedK